MKKIFLDLETTGSNPKEEHQIVEMAGIITINDKFVDDFIIKMQPNSKVVYQKLDKGFAGKSIALQNIENGEPSQRDGFLRFIQVLEKYINPRESKDKYQVIAYNAPHEEDHIKKFFNDNGNKYMWSYFEPFFCTYRFIRMALGDEVENLDNRKLATVCKYMRIKVQDTLLHTAYYDAKLLSQLQPALEKAYANRLNNAKKRYRNKNKN